MSDRVRRVIVIVSVVLAGGGLVSGLILGGLAGGEDTLPSRFALMISGCGGSAVIAVLWSGRRNPFLSAKQVKQLDIAQRDERNVQIVNRAAYLTWFVTFLALALLAMVFLVLGMPLVYGPLLGVIVVQIVSLFVCMGVLDKRM